MEPGFVTGVHEPSGSPPPPIARSTSEVDPYLRNALRYTVSAKDYRILHRFIIARSSTLRKRVPTVSRYQAIVRSDHDFNAAAVRASLKVFLGTQAGLKLWEVISAKLLNRGGTPIARSKASFLRSPNIRLSLSLSTILLLHRLLYRFFSLLRENLLTSEARPFRTRNPRVSRALVSRLAPAIGASLAGFMLGVYPADQLRVTIAIYTFTRALEFLYNKLEDDGWFKNRPWWVGSWMIMPFASGQLLHAFVFDRDCFPKAYGDFILNNTPNYLMPPTNTIATPPISRYAMVDTLATLARHHHPVTLSPTLQVPSALFSTAAAPLQHLSCTLLHPHNPSCVLANVSFFLGSTPRLARFFTLIFALFSLPRYRTFLSHPLSFLNHLARTVLRMTVFVSGSIGTSWGMICAFQRLLPGHLLPTQRYFLGGLLGGLWGFVERRGGRAQFLYTARASIDSLWKVGRKRGWWRGVRNGDVWVFVASLALINGVFELDPRSATGSVVRRGLETMRGRAMLDPTRSITQKEEVMFPAIEGGEALRQ